jgi:hypothetical protein
MLPEGLFRNFFLPVFAALLFCASGRPTEQMLQKGQSWLA